MFMVLLLHSAVMLPLKEKDKPIIQKLLSAGCCARCVLRFCCVSVQAAYRKQPEVRLMLQTPLLYLLYSLIVILFRNYLLVCLYRGLCRELQGRKDCEYLSSCLGNVCSRCRILQISSVALVNMSKYMKVLIAFSSTWHRKHLKNFKFSSMIQKMINVKIQ